MADMLHNSFFAGNRKTLTKTLGEDALIVMTAQSLLQRSGDAVYPFRQDSNFYYLTGVEEPDLVLVMHGSEAFFILPRRSMAEDIFGGSIQRDAITKISGVTNIYTYTDGWNIYKKLQQDRKKIYTLAAAPTKAVHTDAFYTNPARRSVIQKLKRLSPHATFVDIRTQLVVMRTVKQSEEIAAIKKAIAITGEGLEAVRSKLKTGITEHECRATLDYTFRRLGVWHAYDPIVAYNEQAVILHKNKTTNRELQLNEWMLVDVGAAYMNYSADITRMLVNGTVSKRARAVQAAVQNVLQACVKKLRPGLNFIEYARWAEQQVGYELVQLGLIEDVDDAAAIRHYFPHLISHSLGLDTHDVFNYHEAILKEGMVLTVEPGIYIPEEGIGVRIEDDILITKNGAQNLSEHIPY